MDEIITTLQKFDFNPAMVITVVFFPRILEATD